MSGQNANPEVIDAPEIVTGPDQAKKTDKQANKPEGKYREAEGFLAKKGINKGNFDDTFDLAAAIDYAPANDKGLADMKESKSKIDEWKEPKFFNVNDRAVFESRVNKAMDDKKITGTEADNLRATMLRAYDSYATHRRYLDRYLKGQEANAQFLQSTKTELGTTLSEDMAGIYKNLQTNFRKMDGTEKFVVVGGLLLATAMLLQSDNEYVKKFKDTLVSALGIGGVAYIGSKVFKLATGEGPLDALNKAVKEKTALPEFWTNAFKTDAEKAMILRDSTVYLGDKKFDYLAQKYEEAKKQGKDEIGIGSVSKNDMTPKQIFIALDVLFKKYDKRSVDGQVVDLQSKYAKWNPPAKWTEVVTNELIEDQQIDMPDSTTSRMKDGVSGLLERGYARAAIAAGAAWEATTDTADKGWTSTKNFFKGLWRGKFPGQEPTKEDFQEYVKEKFIQRQITTEEFDSYVQGSSGQDAPGFIRAFHEAEKEPAHHYDAKNSVKYFVDDSTGGARKIYLVAENKTGVLEGEEAIAKANDGALNNAAEFLKDYLKTNYKPGTPDYVEAQEALKHLTLFAAQQGNSFRRAEYATALVSMPLPGSPDFKRLMLRTEVADSADKDKKKKGGEKIGQGPEFFGEGDKIDYSAMTKPEQEMFRLKFYVDASNTVMIDEICKYLTNKYRAAVDENGHHMPREAALKRPFAVGVDNGDFEDVEKFVQGYKKELYLKKPLLDRLEAKIQDFEKQASNDAKETEAERKDLYKLIQDGYGYKIRLAILGDTKAQAEVKTWNGFSATSFDKPEDLVEWYGDRMLKQYAPKKAK